MQSYKDAFVERSIRIQHKLLTSPMSNGDSSCYYCNLLKDIASVSLGQSSSFVLITVSLARGIVGKRDLLLLFKNMYFKQTKAKESLRNSRFKHQQQEYMISLFFLNKKLIRYIATTIISSIHYVLNVLDLLLSEPEVISVYYTKCDSRNSLMHHVNDNLNVILYKLVMHMFDSLFIFFFYFVALLGLSSLWSITV